MEPFQSNKKPDEYTEASTTQENSPQAKPAKIKDNEKCRYSEYEYDWIAEYDDPEAAKAAHDKDLQHTRCKWRQGKTQNDPRNAYRDTGDSGCSLFICVERRLSQPMNITPDPATQTDGDDFTRIRYTAEDFIEAYRLSTRPLRRYILILALMLVVFFLYRTMLRGGTSLDVFLWQIGPILIAGPILACLHYLYLSWAGRRTYACQPLAMVEYSFALRPEGLETISDRGQTFLRWEDFIRWRMNDKMTLIYLAPNLFQIFPNRLAEQGFPIEDLKTALASKVGQPTRWYK